MVGRFWGCLYRHSRELRCTTLFMFGATTPVYIIYQYLHLLLSLYSLSATITSVRYEHCILQMYLKYKGCTSWGWVDHIYHILYSPRTVRDHVQQEHDVDVLHWNQLAPLLDKDGRTVCSREGCFVTYYSSRELLGTMFNRSMLLTYCC